MYYVIVIKNSNNNVVYLDTVKHVTKNIEHAKKYETEAKFHDDYCFVIGYYVLNNIPATISVYEVMTDGTQYVVKTFAVSVPERA